MSSNISLLAGNSNPVMAKRVARRLGIPLGDVEVSRYRDGEICIEIRENVRGRDVFVLQSTCAPPNRNLMELLLLLDAVRRASASRITAVIPYLGYARQDRRVRSIRVPISAKVVAEAIASVGVNRVLTVDLHSEQIQGFFSVPVDNIYGAPVMLDDIVRRSYANTVVVSPDIGGVLRARAVAKRLDDAALAIIDKRRPRPNEVEVMNVIGDVDGADCLLVDDIVDTASTLCLAAEALKRGGAKQVVSYCTHPVLSDDAVARIEASALDALVVTDTIPLRPDAAQCPKIRQLSLATLLAESVRRVNNEESISVLFNDP